MFAALEFIDESRVFVALTDSKTYSFVISKNFCDDVPVPFEPTTNIKNHRCAGVAFSKNKAFCIFSMKYVSLLCR